MILDDWVSLLHVPDMDEKQQPAWLERQIVVLLADLRISRELLPPAPGEETKYCLQHGMKIDAIKSYIEQTDVHLRMAIAAVNFLEVQMKVTGLIEK